MVHRYRGGGFIGEEADVNGSIKKFWARLKEYHLKIEEQKTDVGYYMGQSWHDKIGENFKLFKVKFNISEDLNEEWIKSMKQAIKLIKQWAPGLMLEWQMGNKPELFYGANSIYVTTNMLIFNNFN